MNAATGTPAAADPGDGHAVDLVVTITDGLEEVSSHSATSYVAELQNLGAAPVHASLVVAVPEYAEITAAEGGEIDGTSASWALTVEPGETVSVIADARIGDIPEGEFRVTALASVFLGEGVDVATATPLIGSADANLITGVTDPSTIATDADADDGVSAWIAPVAVAGVVLAGALLFVVVRRARRAQA